jgi:hypothetical protein
MRLAPYLIPAMPPLPTNPPQSPNPGQKTSDRPPKTWVIPGLKGAKGWSEKTKPPVMNDLKVPLKRVGFVVVGLFLGIWLISSVYKAVTGSSAGNSTRQPEVATTTSATASATPTATNDSCQGIGAKMQAAKVNSKQVDKVFQAKHPDRLNKPITSSASDAALKQEWCQIADKLSQTR